MSDREVVSLHGAVPHVDTAGPGWGYALDERERLLLVRVMEEAAELQQAAVKILRFGPANWHPDDPTKRSNTARFRQERDDLFEVLVELGEPPPHPDTARLVCTCDEWEPGIEKINGPLLLAQARNPHLTQTEAFHFIPFRYCPWCGNRSRLAARQAEEGKA
jgi:hypothetical protein